MDRNDGLFVAIIVARILAQVVFTIHRNQGTVLAAIRAIVTHTLHLARLVDEPVVLC